MKKIVYCLFITASIVFTACVGGDDKEKHTENEDVFYQRISSSNQKIISLSTTNSEDDEDAILAHYLISEIDSTFLSRNPIVEISDDEVLLSEKDTVFFNRVCFAFTKDFQPDTTNYPKHILIGLYKMPMHGIVFYNNSVINVVCIRGFEIPSNIDISLLADYVNRYPIKVK